MIVAHIYPTWVESAYFYAESELMERLCFAASPLIRRELKQLETNLRGILAESVEPQETERQSL
jgi:hypothetical protein